MINKLYCAQLGLVFGMMFFYSQSANAGDRLLATGGVSQMEGSGGGGLVPWAVITGYGTAGQVGGSVYVTKVRTNGDFDLVTAGLGVGFYNRFELSVSQQQFGLGTTVPDATIKMTTIGAKLRLVGDAIYDQDTWLPQVAIGANLKHNHDFDAVPKAIGAKDATGVDVYLAATKLYLGAIAGRNLLLNATLQATKANQFGILGFGGDKHDRYQLQPMASAAIMLTDNWLIGAEYRAKPDNISVFKEEDAKDIFTTWFPVKNFSLTGAYVDLGNIADKQNQTGWYLSGQLSY